MAVMNIMFGLVTPPYGLLLFLMTKIADVPLRDIVREVMPFLVVMFIALDDHHLVPDVDAVPAADVRLQGLTRSTRMARTRIAVAGAGLIGVAHMARAQASPTCSLVAVVDPAPAAAQGGRAAGVPLYPTLDALFAATKVDGVVLASPNRFHVEQALRCIDEGVGVLVEKPVADTVEEGERLASRGRVGRRARAGRAPPHPQPDHGRGRRR